jgi:DNA mismatch endonuclease, patch repair protein
MKSPNQLRDPSRSRDRISTERRSENMRSIKATDTEPEWLLRRALWKMGLRYRLRRRIHGARPDLVFERARLAVFVDGCFWHGCPVHYRAPTGNAGYWQSKIEGNRNRDGRNNAALTQGGWTALRLWECEVRSNPQAAAEKVVEAIKRNTEL